MKLIRLILILTVLTLFSSCGNTVPEDIGDASCLQSHPGVKQANCTATKLVTYEISTLVGNPASTASTPVDGVGTSAVLGELNLPAFDANGDLYAIDEYTTFSTTNLRIRRVRMSDRSVTTLYGPTLTSTLVMGCSTGSMGSGSGAVVSGKYYFSCNNAIFVYDPSVPATPPSVFAGDAATSGTTDNATRLLARFSAPRSILPLDNDNLLVLDGHAIRRVGVTTDIVQVYCGSISSSGNTNGNCTTALFSSPRHLIRDGDNLFVLDGPEARIRRVAITSSQVYAHADLPAYSSYGNYGTMAIQNDTLHLLTDRWSMNEAYYFQVSTSAAASFDPQFLLKRSAVAYDGIGLSAKVRNTISYLSTFYNGKWTFLDRHVASNTSPTFVRTFTGVVLTF